MSSTVVILKPVQSAMKYRRTTEIRPSTVVDFETRNITKSSREVAEVLRAKYDLNAFEVKTKIN